MDIPQTELAILAFIVVIGPLIFFHELGHFLAARWNNIIVEEFGIGLPPRIVTLFQQAGTKFTLNWLPLGGFMRPAGEDDPTIPGGMAGAPKLARLEVLAAGPLANILIAYVLLVIMFAIGAPEDMPGARIIKVEPSTPAAVSGLSVGDVITAADGVKINQYGDLTAYIYSHVGQPINLSITRGSNDMTLSITPRANPPEGQGPTGIQVEAITQTKTYSVFGAMIRAGEEMGQLFKNFVDLPAAVFRNQVPTRYLRPMSIIGISQVGGEVINSSIQQNVLWPIIKLTSYISLALAITNLLPIPALDGGRILFVLIEAVRGRRVDPRRETMVHLVGFAILLAAMLVFMYLDITDPLIKP